MGSCEQDGSVSKAAQLPAVEGYKFDVVMENIK